MGGMAHSQPPPPRAARTSGGFIGGGGNGDVPVTTTGEFMDGNVKSYNPTKGWGLITSRGIPKGGNGQVGDVFFMKSNLPSEVRDSLRQGQSVTYELVKTPEGKFRAQSIVLN